MSESRKKMQRPVKCPKQGSEPVVKIEIRPRVSLHGGLAPDPRIGN